jgi:hypothetical protein
MNKEEQQIITEYAEQDELNLVVDDVTETKDENMNQETKDFSDSEASVKVTISEAKPFSDQPYASDHL